MYFELEMKLNLDFTKYGSYEALATTRHCAGEES